MSATTASTKTLRIMGKKRGMIQLFDESGALVPCTVIEAEPNVITQIKTKEIDGYSAIQLGFDEITVQDARTVANRCTKPMLGHFKKAQVTPRKHLLETRVDATEGYEVGQQVSVQQFEGTSYVDVIGTSKGKGYQGVMKKYNFRGGPASHGSGFHRHAGSTGMRSTPGRCLPGGPRPSHMGDERVQVQSLKIVAIDAAKNLLIVEGATPGARGSLVVVSSAKKSRIQRNLIRHERGDNCGNRNEEI